MKNKFVKIFVVALAVMSVFIASCVSVFAADYDRTKVIQSIQNSDKVKEVTADKYYFAKVLQGVYTFVDIYVTSSQYQVTNNSIFISNSDCTLYRFRVSDDSEIVFSEQVRSYSDYYVTVSNSNDLSADSLLLCNYDIKNSDGSTFFQKPRGLLDQLLNLVRPNLGEKITADLGTLTVCGIGCLALLIGLSLFPKVLYKFL